MEAGKRGLAWSSVGRSACRSFGNRGPARRLRHDDRDLPGEMPPRGYPRSGWTAQASELPVTLHAAAVRCNTRFSSFFLGRQSCPKKQLLGLFQIGLRVPAEAQLGAAGFLALRDLPPHPGQRLRVARPELRRTE